jgi:predicted AAA+ superfamily ATPase
MLPMLRVTPETFIESIRESYPFHPSIRDIVARFSENRGYQKTRALIRLLRLAVRGALKADGNALLVGPSTWISTIKRR